MIGGGADVAQQRLAASLLDELHLNVLSVALGRGCDYSRTRGHVERDRIMTVQLPTGVTCLRYRVLA
jgi:dihydrofolate reductase